MNKRMICLAVVFFNIIQSTFSFVLHNCMTSSKPVRVEDLNREIALHIDSLKWGYYSLVVWLEPLDDGAFRDLEPFIRFTIVMKQNKKTMETPFEILLGNGLLGSERMLFKVPRDFTWTGSLDITIKDITFDAEIAECYESVEFMILQGLFYLID